jgi:hypothetical protein
MANNYTVNCDGPYAISYRYGNGANEVYTNFQVNQGNNPPLQRPQDNTVINVTTTR